MALVEYSDSDNEQCLPLPDVLSNFHPDVRLFQNIQEYPELHQMRNRTFKHETGNWAASIYLSVFDNDILKSWNKMSYEDYHISLSKTWPVKYHWIESLKNELKKSLSNQTRVSITFDSLKIFVNDEKNRSFIGACVDSESNKNLTKLSLAITDCITKYQAPTYYQNPIFHSSLLWRLGDYYSNDVLNENEVDWIHEISAQLSSSPVSCTLDSIFLKCGHKYYELELS